MDVEQKIKHQQAIATEIFGIAAAHGIHDIILAGGAPRDWYFGRPASDLDFYMSNLSSDFQQVIYKECSAVDTIFEHQSGNKDQVTSMGISFGGDYECNENIMEIQEVNYKDQTVQLIEHIDMPCVLTDFVYSICQVKWTPSTGIVTTPVFDLSAKHSIIVKTGNGYANYRKYAAKIRKKFPAFKFVNKKEAFDYWLKG